MPRLAWMTPLAFATLFACAEPEAEVEEGNDLAAGDAAAEATAPAPAPAGAELACAPTAPPAELAERASPYDSVTVPVGQGQAKICYSRPSLRGRTMIGGEAVPYGQLWRFGANEPTIIHLGTAASIAGLQVEPGSYSLYAVPQEGEEWTLVVNRSTSQWGHESRYTPEVQAQEVGRVGVHAETTTESTEQFTIRANPDGSGIIVEWQNTRLHIPIQSAA